MKATFILFVEDVTGVAQCLCGIDTDKKYHEMQDGAVAYRDLFCTKMNIIEKDGKALAIIYTDKKQGEIMVEQMKNAGSVIPLGCEDGCNYSHREKPSLCFTESDWLKIEQVIPDVDRANFIGDLK